MQKKIIGLEIDGLGVKKTSASGSLQSLRVLSAIEAKHFSVDIGFTVGVFEDGLAEVREKK